MSLMKMPRRRGFLLMALLCGIHPGFAAEKSLAKTETFAELKSLFADPPSEFRTAPFFVWNGKVEKADIDRMLADYKSKGIGGVFIHPRYGLVTEYLSPEWFELIAHTVRKADSLDLDVWLYDENSFPSGFAGGHVPACMPESFNQGQGLEGSKAEVLNAENGKDAFIVLERSGSEFREVEDRKTRYGVPGEYWIFRKTFYGKSKWYGGFSYVDLLVPGVTERFIDVTMKGYERSIGSQFGKRVKGIFTDEPNLRPPGRHAVKWTPDLFDAFQKRWGYDLKTNLPSLFEETGDWMRVRHNTQSLLLDLFIERWAVPWNRYCESRSLNWTGHYWEHGWPDPGEGPDHMAMAAWFQTPGVDMLFNTMDRDSTQFGNIRAARELASVASQFGRARTLSETYGAAGWELRFEDMKRLGDWEYATGVNFMNQHLSYMTLAGDRKHDFPQSFGDHAPWWPYYRILADYYGRLSLALSSGKTVNRVLVLEPTGTAWMFFSPVKSSTAFGRIGPGHHRFLAGLESRQIEYDLASERLLREHGGVKGSRLAAGGCEYDIVVIPPDVENLDGSTVPLLAGFLKGGGRVVSFSKAPDRVDGTASDAARKLAAEHAGRGWIEAKSVPSAAETLAPEGLRFEGLESSGRNLFHLRRRLEDGEVLFLANANLTESVSGRFLTRAKSVHEMDARTGEVRPYACTPGNGGVRVRFRLAPAGSLLLFLDPSVSEPVAEPKALEMRPIPALGPVSIRRSEPNALTLDYCDLETGGKRKTGMYFYTASFEIFKAHGFEENPWVSSSQYKTGILDRDKFGEGTGFTAAFHFQVDPSAATIPLRAAVERPWLWTVSVNGTALKPLKNQWWLDRSFGVFDLKGLVRPGDNTLSLDTHPMSIHAELEPVTLLGEFGLRSARHGWEITAPTALSPGAWKEQGLPFYAHGVTYAQSFDLRKGKHYSVRLGKWNGSVATVRVNGKEAGIVGWQPYEAEISDFVSDGENRVEVTVVGTLKNPLGPHHNVRDRGIVTPWSFKYAPEEQPAGEKYDLEKYGLFEPFAVVGQP